MDWTRFHYAGIPTSLSKLDPGIVISDNPAAVFDGPDRSDGLDGQNSENGTLSKNGRCDSGQQSSLPAAPSCPKRPYSPSIIQNGPFVFPVFFLLLNT